MLCFHAGGVTETRSQDLLHNLRRSYYARTSETNTSQHCYGRLGDPLVLRRSPDRLPSMKVMFRLRLQLGLSAPCINSCHEFALGLDQGVWGAGRGEGNRRAGATTLDYFPLTLFSAF